MSREKIGADSDRGTSHHSSARFIAPSGPPCVATAPSVRRSHSTRRPMMTHPASRPTMPTQMRISNNAKPCP